MLWSKIQSLLTGLLHRSQIEKEMSGELRFHLESRAEDLMRQGLAREEALRLAHLEFGCTEKYKEEARQARGLRLVDEMRADVRYALRAMLKSPAFTFAVVATLALGIGANTAVFSVVDAVLLKPLPVKNPEELVAFEWLRTPRSMVAGYSGSGTPGPLPGQQIRTSFSYLTFQRFRDHNRTLSEVFASSREGGNLNLVADSQAEVVSGQLVTGGYFSGLGVSATVGRTIMPADDIAEANPVAVISHAYWQRRFGGDTAIVGRTVHINGLAVEIVGVSPREFYGTRVGQPQDISMPMAMQSRLSSRLRPGDTGIGPSEWWVQIMGRIKPGVTPQQVLADIQGVFESSVIESWNARPPALRAASFSQRTEIPQLRVLEGRQGPDGPPRGASQILPIIFAIVGLLLLIICANVANLFMARASGRKHEMSVRFAIGAGRGRLIRQLLTESGLLGLIGGILGAILACWGKDFLSWLPPTQTLLLDPQIDTRVLLFASVLSVSTGVVFGLMPGLRATKNLSPGLRTMVGKGRISRSLVSKTLIVAQVSVSLILLIGAALFVSTLQNLQQVDIGFNPANLILFGVAPQSNDDAAQAELYERMIDSLEQVGGVHSVSMSAVRPLSGSAWTEWVVTETSQSTERQAVYLQSVRWNFFDTMEMPLLAGRGLAPTDDRNSPKVAVINEVMAKGLFGGKSPIGSRFTYAEWPDEGPFEIVGVVRDAKYSRLQDNAPSTAYFPYLQSELGPMTFEVRAAVDSAAVISLIQQAIRRVDPTLPLSRVQTQTEQIDQSIGTQRMFAAVSGIFSTVGLLLVSIGLYGVVSFGVNSRINEIGIRMAVGAQSADILRLVMLDTFVLVGIGAAIGTGGAFALTRFIADTLYGIAPHDPVTMVAAIFVMAAVAALAGYLPARRALRVDPMTALRYE